MDKELKVFDKAHQFALKIYQLTSQFPKSEMYGIISQIRRAATSVPANIVEGNSRKSRKEFTQFIYTAKASLIEVNYFLLLAKDLKFIDSGLLNYLRNLASRI